MKILITRVPVNAPRRGVVRAACVALGLGVFLSVASIAVANRLLSHDSSLPTLPQETSSVIGDLEPGQAAMKASFVTSWGEQASLWIVPTTKGVECNFLQFEAVQAAAPFEASGGGACPVGAPVKNHVSYRVIWHPAENGWSVIVAGEVAPGSDITQLGVESPNGTIPITVEHG